MSSEDDTSSAGTTTMELLEAVGGGGGHSHPLSHQLPHPHGPHAPLHPLHHQVHHHLLQTSQPLKGPNNLGTGCKVKRTRQRVDAGEPRNSYASIANFSSTRASSATGYHTLNNSSSSSSTSSSVGYHHQSFNGLSGLASPPSSKHLIQQHLHPELLSPKSLSLGATPALSGDNNNNSGFKSNYTPSASAPEKDSSMILFEETVMQMCASTAPSGYVNGSAGNGHHLKEANFGSEKTNGNDNGGPQRLLSPSSKSKDGSQSGTDATHLLRDILQTGRKLEQSLVSGKASPDQPRSGAGSPSEKDRGARTGGNSSQCSDASEGEEEEEEDLLNEEEDTSRDSFDMESMDVAAKRRPSSASAVTQEAVGGKSGGSPSGSRSNSPSNESDPTNGSASGQTNNRPVGSSMSAEVKRLRVENIVSNMLQGSTGTGPAGGLLDSNGKPGEAAVLAIPVNGCKKRKLYQPQQSKLNGPPEDDLEEDLEEDVELDPNDDMIDEAIDAIEGIEDEEEDLVSDIRDLSAKRFKCEDSKGEDRDNLKQQLEDMQTQLFAMRQRYVQLFEQQRLNRELQQRQQQIAQTPVPTGVPVCGGAARQRLPPGSPVNLALPASPSGAAEEGNDDTEIDENNSEKGDQTPVSHLSDFAVRGTPANGNGHHMSSNVSHPNNIQDPAQFFDEARRILCEQEKLISREGHRPARSAGTFLPPPPPSIGGHHATLADIEWLVDSLKSEVQANVVPNILHSIDAVFSRYFQKKGQQVPPIKGTNESMESSKDLTLLSQMLEAKSPRNKVLDRGSASLVPTSTPLPPNQTKPVNGHSLRSSPYTLPTESAPAPKPSGPAPFAFPPPGFKPSFFLPSMGPPGGQAPPQPNLIPSLAQHFSTIASALNHHREQVPQSASSAPSPANMTRESGAGHRDKERDSNHQTSNLSHLMMGSSSINSLNSSASNNHSTSHSDLPAPEQTEAMSLVVTPKRKRHKVTDTRITPRTVSRLLGQDPTLLGMMTREMGSSPPSPPGPMYSHNGPPAPPPPLVPVSLPTSVAIPNPSLHQELFAGPAFPFADHARFGLFGPGVPQAPVDLDDHDRDCGRDGKVNNNAMAVAVSSALAAHHLSMLAAANRGSPDSRSEYGYPGSGMFAKMGSDGGADGSEASMNESSMYDPTMPLITLTPMHLRKAKLMFFYVRYPSSAILKMYFPDIKFNKNNTAQLVKWFSNFREFYYIQMEKYARQAISEGVKSADDLRVNGDSELLRVLNLHYNRNNHIEVPDHFRFVVEQTLKEFYKAILAGKDTEQSWKKAIYKIIARLDDNVPDYFKSPNFLEQLE